MSNWKGMFIGWALVGLTILFLSCDSGDDNGGPSPNTDSYYPLKVGALWIYNVYMAGQYIGTDQMRFTGTTNYEGINVYILEEQLTEDRGALSNNFKPDLLKIIASIGSTRGFTDYMKSYNYRNEEGLLRPYKEEVFGFRQEYKMVTSYNPAYRLYPPDTDVSVPNSWDQDIVAHVKIYENGQMTEEYDVGFHSVLEAVASERKTVPAGTFDTVKFSLKSFFEEGYSLTQLSWVSKGVGMVYIEVEGTNTLELKSYSGL